MPQIRGLLKEKTNERRQNNRTAKQLFHITVNANGEITSFNPGELEVLCQ